MYHREKPKYKIVFTNRGILIVDSYDRSNGGVYWCNGNIRGYSTNDLIKSIEEIYNA